MPIFKKSITFVIATVSMLWTWFIAREYFDFHPEYEVFWKKWLDGKAPILTVLAWLLFLYLVVVAIRYFYQERLSWHLKLSAFHFYLLFIGVLLFLGGMHFSLSTNNFAQYISSVPALMTLLGRTLAITLALGLIVSVCFALGRNILRRFELLIAEDSLEEFIFSVVLGMAGMMMFLFVLGVLHIINPLTVWLGFFLIIFGFWSDFSRFWINFFTRYIEIKASYFSASIFLLIFFVLVLAMNFIDVMRPIPIGWDDMGFYLNNAKLTYTYGSLVPGVMSYGYIILMSLGFFLFGSAMIGMYISLLGGFIGILAFIQLARRFMRVEYGVLGGVILYLTPMFMFQSSQDLKIDPPLFLFLTASLYAFFMYRQHRSTRWLVLAGVLAGVAMSVKLTTLLLIFPILIILAYDLFSWLGGIAWVLAMAALVLFMNSLQIGTHNISPEVLTTIKYSLTALFIFLQGLALGLRSVDWRRKLKILFLFPLVAVLAFSPWMVKNAIDAGSVSPKAMLFGKGRAVVLDYSRIDIDPLACGSTGTAEEVDRYLGYDTGFNKLFSLPWKMTMNTTVKGFYVDIGFLFLALLPSLILFVLWVRHQSWFDLLTALAWATFWGVYALEMKAQYFSGLWGADSTQFYLLILTLFVVVFATMGVSVRRASHSLSVVLGVMATVIWFFWTFMGNGIIWYGLAGFFPLALLMGYLLYRFDVSALRRGFFIFIWLALVATLMNRGEVFGRTVTIAYSYGIQNAEEAVNNIVPQYVKVQEIVNNDKPSDGETKYIYRIGTFVSFFVEENDQRLFTDSQLDSFKCLDGDGKDDLRTLDRIKKLGFKYLILDLNVATIEKDPNGTLHQKAKRFIAWLNSLNNQQLIKIQYNSKERGITFVEFK